MNRMSFAAPAAIGPTACLTGLALLASCAPVDEEARAARNAAALENVPAVRVVGEPVNCLSRTAIRQSRVQSDRVIDFEVTGGDIYRVTLPNRCPRLGLERAFSYRTSINRLCSTEIIYVLETFGGEIRETSGCGLSEFVPVEYLAGDRKI